MIGRKQHNSAILLRRCRLKDRNGEPYLRENEWNRGGQDEAEERASEGPWMSIKDGKLILAIELFSDWCFPHINSRHISSILMTDKFTGKLLPYHVRDRQWP